MRISLTREKNEAREKLLRNHWPTSRRQARARDVLSMAGKLWNLTCVVRAGRYFVWRLFCGSLASTTSEIAETRTSWASGREFHADLLFWKWMISHKLLQAGESLSAPCYTALKQKTRSAECLSRRNITLAPFRTGRKSHEWM